MVAKEEARSRQNPAAAGIVLSSPRYWEAYSDNHLWRLIKV
jgi:hypothetical protein